MKFFPLVLLAASALCMAASSPKIPDTTAAFGNAQVNTVALPKYQLPICGTSPGCTTVLNRAPITDFRSDLGVKFGIDRVMTQQIMAVPGETGPNGEPVWKPVNDLHDAVRFVGIWGSGNDNYGANARGSGTGVNNNYFEITFYGTGLNILYGQATNALYATVDGGTEGSILLATHSAVLDGRNYNKNTVAAAASGLSLGLHTVKLRQGATDEVIPGYEVINASPTLTYAPGTSYASGLKLQKTALSTDSYNTGFESGTLGTKGGHVLVYQKADGSVKKAVTPTDGTALYLTAASHTNEEIVRTHNWREFGAGRTTNDDFSLALGAALAFTLDDGTTTLVGTNIAVGSPNGFSVTSNGGFFTLTFVGTGLDIQLNDSAAGGSDSYTYSVDGATASAWPYTVGSTALRTQKFVSGLAYGTHTFKMNRVSASTWTPVVSTFIIYAPKTPTLPVGAVALADYFVMGNYVPSIGSGSTISQGVVFKTSVREGVYVGSWLTPAIYTPVPSGFIAQTNTAAVDTNYWQYTFFGTGIEVGISCGSTCPQIGLTVDGATTTGTVVVTNGGNYTTPPYVVSASSGSLVQVTNLSFGVHTIKLAQHQASDSLIITGVGIITPIHAPKLNGPFIVQNTLSIGSQSIRDLRQFAGVSQKMTAQAVGVSADPTNASTTMVPLADESVSLWTTGNPVEIRFNTILGSSVSPPMSPAVSLFVDGVAVSSQMYSWLPDANAYGQPSSMAIIPMSRGYHKVDACWRTNAGTVRSIGTSRVMTVREL